MVSHELRTPITVVLGMAQTLVGRPDTAATADGQEILQRVVRQGRRLRDMVEQLLQASAFLATAARCCGPRRSYGRRGGGPGGRQRRQARPPGTPIRVHVPQPAA